MSEKTRSISISGSGGIMAPGIGTNLISGPISSSPSSIIGGCYTSGASNSGIGGVYGGSNAVGNDSESDLGGHDLGVSGDLNSIMNSSQISTASNDSVSIAKPNIHFTHNIIGSSCRFPKLEECAHFHYERVQIGPLSVRLADEKSDLLNSSVASQSICGDVASSLQITASAGTATTTTTTTTTTATGNQIPRTFYPQTCWFIIKVTPSRSDPFLIKRSFDNVRMLDEMLHRCVYDRKISGLKDLSEQEYKCEEDVEYAISKYLERFSKIASDSLTCGTILTWFQIDNKGRRLPLADTETMKNINTPAVGAAYGVRRYVAQACDEISIEVGDMISVIDMPSPAESIWWRGKKSHLQKSHYEVGFFPQSCVATIGDKVPRHFPLPAPLVGQLDVSPTKPVLRKHGKLIAFFRSFILSRPSRRRLKQTGIYRERVFSCDLSEHLLNSGQEIPMVLKCCAEFIEENGIVDGIYRLSGITSNIQKLRRSFDEERIPDLCNPEIKQDIHAVSSLLKMYFRELPNPLCTYQLYDNFVEAIQTKSDQNERLRLMKETVLKLPPPHYRTLKYLAMHLSKISKHSANTGMTDKNLAIVWAPNLLRSPALESGGVAALRGVGVQAVVTEYLIKNCNLIFDSNDDYRCGGGYDQRMDSLTDCESLLIEQREHDASLSLVERPKSLSAGGAKLISLEEAQERHSRAENFDMNKSIPINAPTPPNVGSYIEVGGGPSSLPDKYHTVLPVPRSWQKRKTHSWKSLFSRNPRSSNSNNDMKGLSVSSPVQKEPPEISIPYSGSEMNVDKSQSSIASVQSQQKPKSIDLFDGSKPMEVCVRSNSIDSLRTGGHSRSVSHDSYFDLLQSPLRGVATCPSRELSELGLNFDREEPEMRIFSESESLVSSPKVGKENIPPSRRVLRARPEEFSSTTNSVNPSPKKQPRLNLLSPSDSSSVAGAWNSIVSEENHHDETCCKRYKLEDQLSDIQFIDCSTPEHTIQNPNTIVYASVQVHNPPSSLSKNSSFSDEGDILKKTGTPNSFEAIFENNSDTENTHTRYSYPVMQLTGGKRKENDAALKERFSYPGSGNNGGKYVCRMPPSNIKMNIEEEKKDVTIGTTTTESHRKSFPQKPDMTKAKNRYSYCDSTSHTMGGSSGDITPTISFSILRSNSADLMTNTKQHQQQTDIGRSKLSVVTPSSPIQSPHYSLLVGETSSENSSALNTPIYEMDITSSHSHDMNMEENNRFRRGTDGGGGDTDVDDEFAIATGGVGGDGSTNIPSIITGSTDDAKDYNYIISENNFCRNNDLTSQLSPHNTTTIITNNIKRDTTNLKRELLSLDLGGGCGGGGGGGISSSKMSIDLNDLSFISIHNNNNNNNNNNNGKTPQNTNTTTSDLDTSQSITPSEFCYQHLNRQSNAVSLENSPNFDDNNQSIDCYDNLDNSFMNYDNFSGNNIETPITTNKSLSSPTSSSSTTMQQQQSQTPTATTTINNKPLTKSPSPIKSTISITYNLKSPTNKKFPTEFSNKKSDNDENEIEDEEKNERLETETTDYELISITNSSLSSSSEMNRHNSHQYKQQQCGSDKNVGGQKSLLETSFDENMVYEQVKFFRTSVSEVNKLLNNGNDDVNNKIEEEKQKQKQQQQQIVPEIDSNNKCCDKEVNSNLIVLDDDNVIRTTPITSTSQTKKVNQHHHHHYHDDDTNDDILMSENIMIDSLELEDDEQNLSLYENVELRKPPIHYENIEISSNNSPLSKGEKSTSLNLLDKQKSLDNDYQMTKLKATSQYSSSPPEKQQKRIVSVSEKINNFQSTHHNPKSITGNIGSGSGNFSVKQLATKFETSPVEQMPPFDFNVNNRNSKKFTTATGNNGDSISTTSTNRDAPCYIRARNNSNKQLNKSTQQITRSLDENAFIREFGGCGGGGSGGNNHHHHQNKRLEDVVMMMNTKSVQQIHEKIDGETNFLRRKSFDFTRPKSLNPPKKLPNIRDFHGSGGRGNIGTGSDNNSHGCGNDDGKLSSSKLKLDLQKANEIKSTMPSRNEIKITPTTENRISLIQNNVIDVKSFPDDDNDDDDEDARGRSNSPPPTSSSQQQQQQQNLSSSNSSISSSSSSGMKVLSGVKLNRERIEQIKEERRHQLNEKFRAESFKSKSKTDLREFPQKDEKYQSSESLRIKSKSRGDVRNLLQQQQRDIDRGTEIMQFSNTRVRRISDEKNQNNFDQQQQQNTSNTSGSPSQSCSANTATAAVTGTATEDFSTKQTVQKFERKSVELPLLRERDSNETRNASSGSVGGGAGVTGIRHSVSSTREKISPQFSIRDVTAMFESRSQNQ